MKMQQLLTLSPFALVCLAVAGSVIAVPADAQGLGTPGGGLTPSRLVGAPTTAPGQAGPQQAPPAIPGVKTEPTAAAAPEKLPSDMAPNDALFDAINRGDTPAARDALNRGADLQATNILGMTPLELSVDLGRDDISFILLSMRGAEPSRRPPPQVATAAPPARPGRGSRITATPVATHPVRAPTMTASTQAVANDPGVPQPSAGFLGFGPR